MKLNSFIFKFPIFWLSICAFPSNLKKYLFENKVQVFGISHADYCINCKDYEVKCLIKDETIYQETRFLMFRN